MEEKTALPEQLAAAKKKLSQLENRQKILLNRIRNEERRVRNHRLIVHGAILEGIFPAITDTEGEIVKEFLIEVSLCVCGYVPLFISDPINLHVLSPPFD